MADEVNTFEPYKEVKSNKINVLLISHTDPLKKIHADLPIITHYLLGKYLLSHKVCPVPNV